MKKVLIIGGIVVAIVALIVFNQMTSKNKTKYLFAEVKKGVFEITVSNSGELIAERSLDIRGPVMGEAPKTSTIEINIQNTDNRQRGGMNVQSGGQMGGQMGGQGGGQREGQGGGQSGGQSSGRSSTPAAATAVQSSGRGGGSQSMGSDMHAADLKIEDIVPEGTIVNEGDYVAQLDRSSYTNTLRTELTTLQTYQTNLQTKLIDTGVVLTNQRDDLENLRYSVEEAEINLGNSQYEPPATIRKAEANLSKIKRSLEQRIKSYNLRVAQTVIEVENQKLILAGQERKVKDIQEFLARFTITAPASGMVIYKKERNGAKRKTGSTLNAFDPVVATLPDLSTMISKIYVSELEVTKVKLGQKANIVIDAFPKKAFTGSVISIGNIGEQLPNSDAKMFEVQIRVDGSDPALRPAMTTGNKIVIKTINDAVFIPIECVNTGTDSIPVVYDRNKTKHVVILGESNDKYVIVEQGLEPGRSIYLVSPKDPEKFRMVGKELIPALKARK